MNTTFKVNSKVSWGSQFSFTLSLKKASNVSEPGVVLPKLQGKGIVLIATATAPFAESQMAMYRALGYECFVATSEEEAIRLLHLKQKIFLVFVDFETLSGESIVAEVNSNTTVVVDVLAGVGTKKHKRRLGQLRDQNLLDGFMLKPLGFPQIQKFLNHLSQVELEPEEQSHLYDVSLLIITKDQVTANVKKNILKSFGKDVDTSNSVADGLEMLSRKYYHLVFISAQIGDVTGFQGASKIRQLTENRNPKVILIGIITAATRGTVQSCIQAGMDDFVVGPTSRESLLEKLKKFFPKADFATYVRRSRGSSGHSDMTAPPSRPESPKHRKKSQATRVLLDYDPSGSPDAASSRDPSPVPSFASGETTPPITRKSSAPMPLTLPFASTSLSSTVSSSTRPLAIVLQDFALNPGVQDIPVAKTTSLHVPQPAPPPTTSLSVPAADLPSSPPITPEVSTDNLPSSSSPPSSSSSSSSSPSPQQKSEIERNLRKLTNFDCKQFVVIVFLAMAISLLSQILNRI